jgi:hypothetical protein
MRTDQPRKAAVNVKKPSSLAQKMGQTRQGKKEPAPVDGAGQDGMAEGEKARAAIWF